jgi:thymidylate synthase
MTETDKQYLNLLKDILNNGVEKDTRAGRVKSVFGRQLRFNLKKGLPLLTTKKVFTKGIIHELLWFLQRPYNSHGAMNIEYLVQNKVHIWDDDAYRWFKTNIANTIKPKQYMVCLDEDDSYIFNTVRGRVNYEYWIENENKINDQNWLQNITKEEFLDLTLQKVEIWQDFGKKYRFGDLGPIYGAQWRHFGDTSIDQIYNVIKTLKENPNDRRMLCVAYNPAKLEDMALPPCHTMFQFYTRELTKYERWELYKEKTNDIETYELITNPWIPTKTKFELESKLEENNIPIYGLSCMYSMRSNDEFLGQPFNTLEYSILTYMIAKLVNMAPDELIASLGDCHIYEAHFDAVKEQLSRKGSDNIPKLIIHGTQESIEDFKYEDFEIIGYNPDPPIKAPLLVG